MKRAFLCCRPLPARRARRHGRQRRQGRRSFRPRCRRKSSPRGARRSAEDRRRRRGAAGATETSSYEKFRQSNQFYYLTGVETPRAILVLDGRAKSSTLYPEPDRRAMERSEGPLLGPAPRRSS
jgi:hypothetical protein